MQTMPRFKDSAVCIRHLDFSETSQVVVLLTREHGKVRGLAKGSRRLAPSSIQRFSGGIELLTLGQVVATTKRTAELATVTEWDLADDHHHLRGDLNAQRVALYAADITHALLADLDPHPGTYDALLTLLRAIAQPDKVQAALLRFQWALLNDVGYRPVLDHDVHDERVELIASDTLTFDPHAGGFTTDTGDPAWRVRKKTLETLQGVARGSDAFAEPGASATDRPEVTRQNRANSKNDRSLTLPALNEGDARRANRLLCSYARAILDRQLPTMDVVLSDPVR